MFTYRLQITSYLLQNGNTALIYASSDGRDDVAQLLVDAGANKEFQNKVLYSRKFSMGSMFSILMDWFLYI